MKVKFNGKTGQFEVTSEEVETIDMNRFLNILSLRGLSPYTVRSYGYDLIVIHRWLRKQNLQLKTVKGKDLYDLILFDKNHGLGAKTINRRLVTIRIYYRFLFDKEIEQGPGINSPSGHYRGAGSDFMGLVLRKRKNRLYLKVKEDSLLTIPLKAEETNKFIKDIHNYRDLAIVGLMLFCGLRSCEIRTLEIETINFSERKLTVMGKGSRERMVPLTDQLIKLIRSYIQIERPRKAGTNKLFTVIKGARRGEPLTAAGLRSYFRYRRQISGVNNANPHRFRHTFGTNMAKSKMNIFVLQELLGHSKGSPVTQRYIHIALSDVADAFYEANREIEKKYSGLS